MSRRGLQRSGGDDDGGDEQYQGPAPGRRSLTQSLLGGEALAAADRGLSGGGSTAYPHRAVIESSFGRSLNATAHLDDHASEACATLGAEAYAYGNAVAFNSSAPSLHTAAHEAAHTIQQEQGVQLKDSVGTAGDSYEQHADAVADLVVAGKASAHMFGGDGGGRSTGIQRKALQLDSTPNTNLTKGPTPQPQVDVNGLPVKGAKPATLNADQQAFFNKTVEANSTIGVVAGKFSSWLSSMTIPYAGAWNAHRRALTAADQAAKDANALVIGVVMAGAGGALGGVVGDTFKNLGAGAAMVDGMKDLAKMGSRQAGTVAGTAALSAAAGFQKMPTDPLMWSQGVSLRVQNEVITPALEIVQGWQHSLNADPGGFDIGFDPVEAVNSKLRLLIGGKALNSLKPEDQAALQVAFERGFLNDWIQSEAAKVFMHLSQSSWGKAKDKLVQYGLSIPMPDVEAVLNAAVSKGVQENNEKAVKSGHGLI